MLIVLKCGDNGGSNNMLSLSLILFA